MSAHDDDGPFGEEASESATTMSECADDGPFREEASESAATTTR